MVAGGGGSPTVKSVFETSKKMLPTASILTRAVVVEMSGMVTSCEPSFAVLAASSVTGADLLNIANSGPFVFVLMRREVPADPPASFCSHA